MSETLKITGVRLAKPWKHRWPVFDSRGVRKFLQLFLTIAAAFLAVWQGSLYFSAVIENEKQRLTMREATHRAGDLMGASLQTFAADLKMLTLGRNLNRLAGGDMSVRDAVAREFQILASLKPDIMQIRFIGSSGDEIVRVDRRNQGVLIVEGAALQNRMDRPYFQQAIATHESSIYMSPIDLKAENGAVEEPWLPVLRLAAPLSATDGGITGIAVIDIAAARLIANLERVQPVGAAPLQFLTEYGYWLAGVPDDRLWGFTLDHDISLANEAPEVWRRIASHTRGAFDNAGTHYVFETLNPGIHVAKGARTAEAQTGGVEWTILATVPLATLAGVWSRDHAPTGAAAFLVIAAISLGWTHAATARRSAEEKAREATAELSRIERLAGLGSLVAGVAHELNTPIGNAVTVASTLSESAAGFRATVESGQVRRAAIDDFLADMGEGTAIILRSLSRAADLLGHFKQVAIDRTSEQRRAFRMAELMDDVASTLHSQFRDGRVALETDITSTAVLDGYPGPLGQVLINLISNALLHGFDNGAPGVIVVSARDRGRDMVEIVVRDTGKGIPPDSLERIFDPFFTTRLGQGGSGLGLSIVFNIVTNMLGGAVRAENDIGSGARMTVRLPRTAPIRTGEQIESAYNVERSQ